MKIRAYAYREYEFCTCWYAKHFSEPFKDSNGYGESIARLSNMLGGGVMVQRFGDLIRGQTEATVSRIAESYVTPTLVSNTG